MGAKENKGPGMTAASIVLTVIAVVIFLVRSYSQRLVKRGFSLDEIFLSAGLILTIGLCIETCLCFHWGAGRHMEDILLADPNPLPNLRKYWIAGYASVVTWAVAMFAIKLSLLSLYKRIFLVQNTVRRWFRVFVYAVMGYVICSSIAIIFSYIFICTPISHWWTQANAAVGKPVPKGECPNLVPRGLACTALNIVSDILTFSLGVSGLWTLQMDRQRKFMVGGILAMGSACCIVSIVRLPILLDATFSNDPTWSNANSLLIGVLEGATGIISASLPGLAPLVRRWQRTVKARKGTSSDSEPGPSHEYSNRANTYAHKMSASIGVQGMPGRYIPMDDMNSDKSAQLDTTPLSPTQQHRNFR
ncbi:hypothetical protein BDV30DRAFT_216831 [Aspergillus minisclerotigenes]|uniref:Rhodopsin domain-containing protein n=1 Tax=Aspergillus minisclerotigenes TaxID=656917 RepID=A0A5N6IU79_9EURO|nr:hypothetical protein BDV30DRAFT_216831 [Aspergillus minisclerotigenes]